MKKPSVIFDASPVRKFEATIKNIPANPVKSRCCVAPIPERHVGAIPILVHPASIAATNLLIRRDIRKQRPDRGAAVPNATCHRSLFVVTHQFEIALRPARRLDRQTSQNKQFRLRSTISTSIHPRRHDNWQQLACRRHRFTMQPFTVAQPVSMAWPKVCPRLSSARSPLRAFVSSNHFRLVGNGTDAPHGQRS